MTTQTHTPGPWATEEATVDDYEPGGIIIRAGEVYVARIAPDMLIPENPDSEPEFTVTDEDWANARLIAAAPEMYEALNVILNDCDTCFDDGDDGLIDCAKTGHMQARAAIAKAEGNAPQI